MDKYVFLVLLLAPGFIASTTATFCGNQPNKNNEFGYVMRYFSYSFFSLLIMLAICFLFGLIESDEQLDVLINRFNTAGYSAKLMLIATLSSVLVGMAWSLFLRYKYLHFFNYLKSKELLLGTITYVDNTTLEHLFLDNKNHFVTVEQDGKEISIGFIDCIGSTDTSHLEISVIEHPGYREWMNKQRNEGRGMTYCIKTYIDFDNHVVIREFNYPEEWSYYEE